MRKRQALVVQPCAETGAESVGRARRDRRAGEHLDVAREDVGRRIPEAMLDPPESGSHRIGRDAERVRNHRRRETA